MKSVGQWQYQQEIHNIQNPIFIKSNLPLKLKWGKVSDNTTI